MPDSRPEPSPMPETETTPALTQEEWALGEVHGAMLDGDRLYVYANSYYGEADEDDRHALAALALYQQPFGFTLRDYDDLLMAAYELRGLDRGGSMRAVLSVADRIKALLPPE